MYPSTLKALNMLWIKKRKGVSFDDFPTGYRLSAAIFNLRQAGYNISTHREEMSNGGYRARYYLINEAV